MGATIDCRVLFEYRAKRADLNRKIRERTSQLRDYIEKTVQPVLAGLPALLEETVKYCEVERALIFKRHPEFRNDAEIEAEKEYFALVYPIDKEF